MKKIKEIYYIENTERRTSDYSTGLVYVCEDGSVLETMTTDVIAYRHTEPNGKAKCRECGKEVEITLLDALMCNATGGKCFECVGKIPVASA